MYSLKFKIKQFIKMFSQHIIFPLVYNLNRLKTVDTRLVVFADAHSEKCPPHMKPIVDALMGSGLDVREYFFNLADIGAFAGMKKMIAFMKLYAQSGCVVICNNFLPVSSCKKRQETRVIQLWHGCGAFKRFGWDAYDDIPEGYRGNVYKNYNLVTVSGEICVPFFESAMRLEKGIVRALGCCITDRFFDRDYQEACRAKFKYFHPDAAGKRVVLWAPTFRGNAGAAFVAGEQYIDKLVFEHKDIYCIKTMSPMVSKNKTLLGNGSDGIYASSDEMNSDELLVCADVLITDYSSIFFEYLLLDRPIIFFAPDYDDYSKQRGFYLDYDKLPGQIIKEKNIDEAADCLYNAIVADDKTMSLRHEFKETYMSACDGHATERIIAEIKKNA